MASAGCSIHAGQRRWLAVAAAVATGFGLSGLASLWPLPRYFLRGIPGDGFDGWQNYWNLWWVRRALLELGQSPWQTQLLDYPAGVSLLFHTLNIPNALLSLPVQELLGIAAAYNTVVLASFALSGLGAYLLALRVLGRGDSVSRGAALVAGAAYALCPFHFAHVLGHMQVFSLQWLPFSCLGMWSLLTRRDGGPRTTRSTGRILVTALFLALAALTDWYNLLYLGLLACLWLPWLLWARWRRERSARLLLRATIPTAIAWAGALAALSPLLLPMVREAARSDYMLTDASQIEALSADLVAFVLPQEMHPLWGEWSAGVASRFTSTSSERMLSFGVVPLLLAAAAAWHARGRLRLWLWTALAFAVLALGPTLHVLGRVVTVGGRPVVLPYLLLYWLLPFMGIARSVGRTSVVAMLAVAVLAAAGLRCLVAGRRRWGFLATILAIGCVCLEFCPVPYPHSELELPLWAERVDTASGGAVLNLPANWDRPQYLLHQTLHGMPLISGYTSRRNPTAPIEQYPGLQQLRALGDDVLAFPDPAAFASIAADLGLRYVVLDAYQMPGEGERAATLSVAARLLGAMAPVYQDDRFTVYEMGSPASRRPYVRLVGAFGPRVEVDGRPRRAVCADCGLQAVADEALVVRARCGGDVTVEVTLAPGESVLLAEEEPACKVLEEVRWSALAQ